jgi:hypothetical protein
MDARKEIHTDFGDDVKHEARLKLWLPALKNLRDELGRHLRYFTLPGPKAYDVIKWKIEDLVKYDGRGFTDVCFCDINHENFVNAKRLLGYTHGIEAKFEDIIQNYKDPKYGAFWDLFPYDVYNLDFCGTCFEGKEPLSKTFKSIIKLVNSHVKKKKFNRFLLFLTIRIDRNKTNNRVIKDLKSNLESNSRNNRFSNKIYKIAGKDIEEFINKHFYLFMLISIPKLIAYKLIPQTIKFSGKIENIKGAYYARNNRYYIGKFVFLIGKEKTSLKINPAWYEQCIDKTLDFGNIIEISPAKISSHTKNDLKELKKEIASIEKYD